MTGDGFDLTTLVRYDNRDTGHERGEFLTWNYRTIGNEILGHLNEKNGEVSGNPFFLWNGHIFLNDSAR